MATKAWYAATHIKFGKRTEDGSQDGKYEQVKFKPGDEVTGLSKDDMLGLYNAGALTNQKPETAEDNEDDGEDEKANSDAANSGKGDGSAPAKPTKAAPAKAAQPSA
jgi:hypothetical protein